MGNYLIKLFNYTDWANKKVLDCLTQQKIQDEKILTLTGHILAAQSIWLSRMTDGSVSTYQLWHNYSLLQVTDMTDKIGIAYKKHLSDLTDFSKIISYKNMAGNAYQNTIEDILMHVGNHGTYHRGQIALLLREKGYDPVSTDYILYQRSLANQL